MPQQFEGTYRLVGAADGMRRMALYDLARDDSVWVNTVGYGEEISTTLDDLQSGNVIDATVTDQGEENEYWNLLDISVVKDDRLYYFETDGYAPGPTDDFWNSERDSGAPVFTAAWRDDSGDAVYEIQLQKQILDAGDDTIDVFEEMQRGELVTEELFEATNCDYLDTCQRILVVNPTPKPYVVMYLFSDKCDEYDDIYKALYETQ